MIDRPVDHVVKLFDNPDNLKSWLPDLASFEHISAEPGQVSSKSRMLFKTKRSDFEMTETIISNDLPGDFTGAYEKVGKGVFNTMSSRFGETGQGRTRYEIEIDCKFSGFMMRLMGITMGWIFRKQSYKSLERFKAIAESERHGA